MSAEELKAALRDLPAGPFTIYVKDRTPIEALHTDYAMLSPRGQTLNVWDAERMHWLEVASITRVSCKAQVERVP